MKNLKSVFKGENIEVFKLVKSAKKEKISYVVDTYLDDMYMCIPNRNMMLARTYNADELRETIEADKVNEYKFTKEAYSRCKDYFLAIAL